MKIRIKGNSIRIRLTRSEVDNFAKDGYLEEKTEFGNSAFTYALKAKNGIAALEADLGTNNMIMFVPTNIAKDWAGNEIISYDNNMDIGSGKKLFLLLEKDFKCLDSAFEDQSDNFENPNKTC